MFTTIANNRAKYFVHDLSPTFSRQIVEQCAGTSLREVLITWARSEGWSGAVVEYCRKKTFTNVSEMSQTEKHF